MKVAISSSLQGYPEESSPEDPLDTRRLGEYVANRLQLSFPQIEVDLYNRDDFPGMGDAYIALREAVVRWGADVHVTIHQDASIDHSIRGWHIIYYHAEALSLADELLSAMRWIPSPVRYGGIVRRSNVAVLKRPPVTVLVEAGFYTNPEDEAIGVVGWGEPIVKGISNYLIRHQGIYPQEKEEGDIMLPCPVQRNHVFPDIWQSHFATYYLHMKNESDKPNEFRVIVTEKDAAVITTPLFTVKAEPFALKSYDLKDKLKDKYDNRSVCITVQSDQLSAVYVREA